MSHMRHMFNGCYKVFEPIRSEGGPGDQRQLAPCWLQGQCGSTFITKQKKSRSIGERKLA